jgi:hypothetical protein
VEKQQNLPPNDKKTHFLSPFPKEQFHQNASFDSPLELLPARNPKKSLKSAVKCFFFLRFTFYVFRFTRPPSLTN